LSGLSRLQFHGRRRRRRNTAGVGLLRELVSVSLVSWLQL
jgi:hypothetical protein